MDDRVGTAPLNAPGSPPSPQRWRRRLFAAGAAGAVLLSGLLWWAGLERLGAAYRALGWSGAAWLAALYLVSQTLRALRFALALPPGERPATGRLFAVVSLHQASNHLLPARLGELTFPLLMRRFGATPTSRGLAVLLLVRLQEIAVLGAFLAAALALLVATGRDDASLSPLWWAAGALVVLPALARFALRPALQQAARWATGGKPTSPTWRQRLATLAGAIAAELGQRQSHLAASTALTGAIWATLFFLFAETLRLTGTPVSLAATVVGSTFANATHLLPVNTLGSFGSLEAGWTVGFALMGVPAKDAFAAGLAMHTVVFSVLLATALPGWWWLARRAPVPHP